MGDRHSCWTPRPTPPRRDTARPPHARPGHRRNRHGHAAWDQFCIEPMDHFPELVLPEADRARHPVHANVT
jgi:hypothetical protein